MKKRILALVMALSVTVLSGCSANFTDGGNMMRPPRPTGDKAEIQNIIEEKAGSGFTFVYPQSGDCRSAVTMKDLDNDGSDEAIALFSSGSENTKLNLMIMTKQDESWKSVATIQSSAAGVDRMFFADINGDSKLELFIGWTSLGSNEKQISAYAFDDEHNQIREMPIDSTYNELACADFDNDNQSELILLTIANKDDGSLAKFFKYSTNEKRPMLSSSVPLDTELTRISNACVGMVDSNTRALIIDGENHSGTISTQIIYWDSKEQALKNPLSTSLHTSANTNVSTRTTSTISKDINNDGIIEIPSVATMPAGNKEDATTICSLTTWNQYQLKTNSFKGVLNMIINYKDGYYFKMPEKWLTDNKNSWSTYVTARVNNENRTLSVYQWLSDETNTGYIGDKLFTIYVYSKKEWDSESSNGKILLRKTDNSYYAVKIDNSKNKLSLNEEELNECFMLIS